MTRAMKADPRTRLGPELGPDEILRLRRGCRAALTGRYLPDDGTELARIAAWAKAEGIAADSYGDGGFMHAFEARIASMLGMDAACFMPTGTMAQLIALRMYADETGRRSIGMHPSSHHVLNENDSYAVLHGLRAAFLSPWNRPFYADDIAAWESPLAAVSVELPMRWLGGQLPSWDELAAVKDACARRGIKVHMDGARLWEAQPFYARPLPEICRGFDSVYVSFYKGVGALGGAALAGPAKFVERARKWRRRHGGDLFQLWPLAASAHLRLDDALARMPRDWQRAQAFGALLAEDRRLRVRPRPAETPLLRVYFEGDAGRVVERRNAVARERGIWVCHRVAQTRVPGFVEMELQVGEGMDGIADAEAKDAVLALVEG